MWSGCDYLKKSYVLEKILKYFWTKHTLSGICFKIIHTEGGAKGMGASRDQGKLATLFVAVKADEDGSRDSLYYFTTFVFEIVPNQG